MKTDRLLDSDSRSPVINLKPQRWLAVALSVVMLSVLSLQTVSAQPQSRQKLPSPEKIVGDYLKAVGGKKQLAAIRDAVYEGNLLLGGDSTARARIRLKAPAFSRFDVMDSHGESSTAVNLRSAWSRGGDGLTLTLRDAEANSLKLMATLGASRFIDYKKMNVLARTLALGEVDGEPAYVVVFSMRNGARIKYWFSTKSKLLLKAADEDGQWARYGDYRAVNHLLEPHRIETNGSDAASVTFALQSVRYNTGLSEALFDPPSTEALDIPALLKEVEKNQEKLDERVTEYAFTEKRTERKINDRGEIKEEKITVYKIYPLPGGCSIYKLISENNVPLSAERATKQDKNIAEAVAKCERERGKREQKKREAAEKNQGEAEKKKDDDDDISVAQFLRACEFVGPRRERLRDRDAVVFDFRPRPGFRPRSRAEDIITKLIGIVWIDPEDKQVIRLEAKLAEGYKMGGGLVASIRPGSSFVFEQTRTGEGVWLPRFAQVNFSAKLFLFKGIEANETREFSDYRHFKTETKDYKLDAPAGSPPAPQP